MIKDFLNKRLEDFYYDDVKKGLPAGHLKKIDRILVRLDNAEKIEDMNYSGAKLHKLVPKKNNRWAVYVCGNYRITFTFKDGNASKIDYLDYH